MDFTISEIFPCESIFTFKGLSIVLLNSEILAESCNWSALIFLTRKITGKLLFDPNKDSNYSRDYYHLQLIQETCGDFPKSFLKKTSYYKQFFDSNYKLKGYESDETNRLDRKLNEFNFDKPTREAIKQILIGTLTIDPIRRWTIDKLWSVCAACL